MQPERVTNFREADGRGEHRPERLLPPTALPQAGSYPEPQAQRPKWARSDNLPVALTSFVGREREIAEVDRLLDAHRLVTLVGAPGVGKTRLALRVAELARDRFRDGIWLVELAPLEDAALISQAVATVLGIRESPVRSPRSALLVTLQPAQLVLLLDNCEHLV